jgi:hypothetical protein
MNDYLKNAEHIDSHTKVDWILLNVGGRHFLTTRSTLSKEASFLERLCQYKSDLKTDVVSWSFRMFILEFSMVFTG